MEGTLKRLFGIIHKIWEGLLHFFISVLPFRSFLAFDVFSIFTYRAFFCASTSFSFDLRFYFTYTYTRLKSYVILGCVGRSKVSPRSV